MEGRRQALKRDAVLRGELERMKRPHAAIHGLASEVEALRGGGRVDEASTPL